MTTLTMATPGMQSASALGVSASDQDIFTQLGAQEISSEEKMLLLAQMIELIQYRVLVKIATRLSPDLQQKLEVLLEKEDDDSQAELSDFMTANVPDYEAIFSEESDMVRQELVLNLAE